MDDVGFLFQFFKKGVGCGEGGGVCLAEEYGDDEFVLVEGEGVFFGEG